MIYVFPVHYKVLSISEDLQYLNCSTSLNVYVLIQYDRGVGVGSLWILLFCFGYLLFWFYFFGQYGWKRKEKLVLLFIFYSQGRVKFLFYFFQWTSNWIFSPFIMSYPITFRILFQLSFCSLKFDMWKIKHLDTHLYTTPIPKPR